MANPRDKDCTPQPMPTTGTANRIVPNQITTFANESRPAPKLGSLNVNPGRSAGK